MRLKYYLRGIGIGVIVTTLVLMIALMIHKSELLSDAEICDRAAELGMVMPEETVKSSRDTLSSNGSVEQKEQEDIVSDENTDDKSVTNAKKDTGNVKTDAAADKPAETTSKKSEVEQVELSIVGGEYSDIVSEKLRKAGLIEDPEDFNKYLAAGDYDNLIQPGTYVIPVGADYATIVKIITEKKDT